MGEDVESILHKLYMESGQDIERCQRGIVYLDEIDKVSHGTGLCGPLRCVVRGMA